MRIREQNREAETGQRGRDRTKRQGLEDKAGAEQVGSDRIGRHGQDSMSGKEKKRSLKGSCKST
jgi:hypothetical protein